MAKIQKMDAHLTNMIAAGEVVERPMGVVKELIENSIDANAKCISIHIIEGGLKEITIIDDGYGMSAQDASLAFERHATSKIHHINDLWKISTMGFRGEALPSIASVSHTILKTNDGNESTMIEIAYGVVKQAKPIASNKGTSISVCNLFQKMPARLKHLKSYQYEFSLISDVVQKFALAYSDIAFILTHDGKEVFSTSGKGNVLEVIMAVYGREAAKHAIALHNKDDDFEVSGYAIQPSFNRASKYYMLFYINQRMVRLYRLQKAVMDAYAPYLPSDRYPVTIINIKMDPKLVDVNVHPSKWEVRLSKENQAEKLIRDTISEALRQKMQPPKVEKIEKVHVEMPKMEFVYESVPVKEEVNKTETMIQNINQEVREEFLEYKQKQEIEKTITPISEPKVITASKVEAVNPSFPYMKVIGQLHDCYILAQSEQGMYIIDQHAAQERYHYEQIKKLVLEGVCDTQPLLIPITIESTSGALAQIQDMNQLFNQIGIHLEAFGNQTFVVRELPVWVSHVEEEKLIQDMIDFYLKNREINLESLRKHAIASMACHSSIRFHRHLTMEEMQQVIEDLRKCEQPYHCPHGRPTFIELTLKDMEKDFLRVK